jgi:hypothetical protein
MDQSIWLAIASGLSLVVGGILQKIIDGLNKKKAEEFLISERKKIADEARQARVKLQEKVEILEKRIEDLVEENNDLQKESIRLEYSYKFCLNQFRILKKYYPELLADINSFKADMEEDNDKE